MATRQQLEQALQNPNVRKMLDLISYTEGTQGNGYRTAFGGGQLNSLKDHPRYLKSFRQTDGKSNKTSAAGRYQFLSSTWDGVARQYGLNDFSPKNQDLGAVALLFQRGAIPALLKGDYQTAIQKTGAEWASLPSSNYKQNKKSWDNVNKFLGVKIGAVSDNNYDRPALDPRLSMSMKDLLAIIQKGKDKRSDNEIFIELANNNGRAGLEVNHLLGQGFDPNEIARQLGLNISAAQPTQQAAIAPSFEDFAASHYEPVEAPSFEEYTTNIGGQAQSNEPIEPPSFEEFSANYEQTIEPTEPPSFEEFAANYEQNIMDNLTQTDDALKALDEPNSVNQPYQNTVTKALSNDDIPSINQRRSSSWQSLS